jgi:hypothetical protein
MRHSSWDCPANVTSSATARKQSCLDPERSVALLPAPAAPMPPLFRKSHELWSSTPATESTQRPSLRSKRAWPLWPSCCSSSLLRPLTTAPTSPQRGCLREACREAFAQSPVTLLDCIDRGAAPVSWNLCNSGSAFCWCRLSVRRLRRDPQPDANRVPQAHLSNHVSRIPKRNTNGFSSFGDVSVELGLHPVWSKREKLDQLRPAFPAFKLIGQRFRHIGSPFRSSHWDLARSWRLSTSSSLEEITILLTVTSRGPDSKGSSRLRNRPGGKSLQPRILVVASLSLRMAFAINAERTTFSCFRSLDFLVSCCFPELMALSRFPGRSLIRAMHLGNAS